MDKALSRIRGAVALVDVRISVSMTPLLILRLESIIISGTALVDPHLAFLDASDDDAYQLVQFSEEGEITDTVALTNEEYMYYLQHSIYIP